MSKKSFLAVVIVVALLILGLGVYLLFFTKPNIGAPDNKGTYSPFGNYTGSNSSTSPSTSTASSTASDETPNYTNTQNSPLIKISGSPVAGAGSFERKAPGVSTSTTVVRYTERATGHTMDFDMVSGKTLISSNTTIPSIYKAWWSGSNLIAQFLDQNRQTVKTYAGSLPINSTSTKALSGSFLANNIYSLAISPKGNKIFYLQTGDGAEGIVANIDGSGRSQILTFPFNEWQTQWPSDSAITLTTKASSGVPGFMYFLSPSTGTLTKAMGNIEGLTTRTNPSLSHTLYSASTDGGLTAGVYDIKKDLYFDLQNATLPEKCVWSTLNKNIAYCAVPTSIAIGKYPDDWYQGNVSFVDNIYKMDVSLPSMNLIYSLPKDQNIDAINLNLDQKENELYFTNKNDFYLWGLDLKNLNSN